MCVCVSVCLCVCVSASLCVHGCLMQIYSPISCVSEYASRRMASSGFWLSSIITLYSCMYVHAYTQPHTQKHNITTKQGNKHTHSKRPPNYHAHMHLHTNTCARTVARTHTHTHTVCFKMSSPNDHLMKRGKAL